MDLQTAQNPQNTQTETNQPTPGSEVAPSPPDANPPSLLNNSHNPPVTHAPGGGKKGKKGKLWLIVLLVIVLAASGAYLLTKNKDTSKQSATKAVVKNDIPLIRFGTDAGPINVFYPSANTTSTSGQSEMNNQIYEGLVGWQGGDKIVPLLATSWTNPDDSTWVFTLRPGVKFHSGRTMTATDVKYSLDNFKATYDDVFGLSQVVKSVTVLAPNKVQIVTDGPDPILLNRLTYFYIIDSHNTKPDDPVNGTGPYVLKPATDPAKDNVTDLVAYNGYWGGHVYTRELQFQEIIKESDQAAALKAHKIDVFDNVVGSAVTNELKAAGLRVLPQESLSVNMIAINTQGKAAVLSNLKLRQALNTGINRSALIKAAGVDGTPTGQYMASVIPGYVPKITVPAQNITQAKALVAQSGISNPSLTLSYGTDDSNNALMKEFQKEAAAIGITVKLDPVDDLNALVDKYSNGKTDMFFFANSTNLFDASDILSIFQIPGVYDNADVDNLLTQANQTLAGAKRLALLQQASEKLNSDVAGIPLYVRASFIAQTSKNYTVKGDVPGLNGGAYFWKVYQQ